VTGDALTVQPTAEERTSGQAAAVRELLVFDLAGDRYALPLSVVREIMRPPAVTEVPRAPEAVLGVISARGRVTTLLDLRMRLRLEARPWASRTRVLLVEHRDEVVGLLVDGVRQVQRLPISEIELSSGLGAGAPAHLLGIGRPTPPGGGPRAEGDLLLLLDLEPLLALERSAIR
jgi:purine-binding chemotaxis protein CheW